MPRGNVEYTGRITVDAEELQRVAESLQRMLYGAAPGGGAAPASPTAQQQQAEVVYKGTRKAHQDPTFMAIFRPLVALEGIKQLIAQSRLANTYLGAMGKVFASAIDLLLLPFTPILNLLLVGLAKILPGLLKFADWLRPKIEEFIDWVKKVWDAISNGDIVKLLRLMKDFFTDPKKWVGAIATVGGGLLFGQMLANALGLGSIGPLALLSRAVRGGGAAAGAASLGGLFVAGRRPFPGFGLSLGRLAAGGALIAGGELLGHLGLGEPGRVAGMLMTGAGIGAALGGPLGALIGAGVAGGIRLGEELPGGFGRFFRSLSGFFGFQRPEPRREAAPAPAGGVGTYVANQQITINVRTDDPNLVREIIQRQDEFLTRQAKYG